ncbi:hypothetical protein WA026_006953 [Henosepilachna vigintioctopunctata]|uniref:Uncharacterized protein n=1 Tax=Henosepilachna vigintioctopunctata TaxID=420089 RepID=A0AAW1V2T0_9CUCU
MDHDAPLAQPTPRPRFAKTASRNLFARLTGSRNNNLHSSVCPLLIEECSFGGYTTKSYPNPISAYGRKFPPTPFMHGGRIFRQWSRLDSGNDIDLGADARSWQRRRRCNIDYTRISGVGGASDLLDFAYDQIKGAGMDFGN